MSIVPSSRESTPDVPLPRSAVERVLADAVADQLLAQAQADELSRRLRDVPLAALTRTDGVPHGSRANLAELAGYAGGALLLGAAGLFLSTEWSGLSDGGRAAVLLGVSAVLFAGGAVVVALSGSGPRALGAARDSARRRLTSTLWALGAAAAFGGVAVAVDAEPPLAGAAVGLVLAAIGYALVSGAPGHLVVGLAAATTAVMAVDEWSQPDSPAWFAVALMLVAVVWGGLASARLLVERDLGFAVASVLGILAGQLPVLVDDDQGLGYALTALVAVWGFAGYLVVRSWPVLAGGVVATTLVVPEALHDWTDGSVSVAGALLVAGLTLLAASVAGLRLRRVPG